LWIKFCKAWPICRYHPPSLPLPGDHHVICFYLNNIFFTKNLCCFIKLWLRLPLEKSEPLDDDHAKANNNNHMVIFWSLRPSATLFIRIWSISIWMIHITLLFMHFLICRRKWKTHGNCGIHSDCYVITTTNYVCPLIFCKCHTCLKYLIPRSCYWCFIYNAIVLVSITNIGHSFTRSTLPSINSLGRWFGEPVRAAILQTNVMISFIQWTRIDMVTSSQKMKT
jgi:hypothetical protein